MTDQNDKGTGFFSLPRELRDTIYDMARQEHSCVVKDVMFRYRAAIPTLRLVSRQLKLEYDQRPAADTSVHIFDVFNECRIERFPRLATKSRYLEMAWTREDLIDVDHMQSVSDPYAPIEYTLIRRLRSLQNLVDHLPEVKEVHIEVQEHETHNLKSIADQLVACPVLTSFSIKSPGFLDTMQDPVSGVICPGALEWVPWSHLQESVNLAIWSPKAEFPLLTA